jgi:hypothetical protein
MKQQFIEYFALLQIIAKRSKQGTHGKQVVESFVLESRLTSECHFRLLEDELPVLLTRCSSPHQARDVAAAKWRTP